LAWSFATLEYLNTTCLDALSAAARSRLNDARPQHLSNSSWAYSARLVDHPLRTAISASASRTLSDFRTQSLVTTAWSFAVMPKDDRPLREATAAQALRTLGVEDPYELTNIAWAFSQIAFTHLPLWEATAAASLPPISSFESLGLAKLACAVAKIGGDDCEPLLYAIAEAASPKMSHEFMPLHRANIAWSFSQCQFPHSPLRASIASASIPSLHAGGSNDTSKAGGSAFSVQNIANMAWAFARL